MTSQRLRLLTLNVTQTCDASCMYCHWWRVRGPHPPLDSLVAAVDEAAALGALAVRISGGEPLLRQDLPALVSAIRRRELVSMICTAGNRARDSLLALLNAGLDLLSVSIDTIEPTVFHQLRGYALESVLENVVALADLRRTLGFEIIISTVLTRLNVDLLADLLAFVRRLDLLWSITPFQDGEPSRSSPMRKLAFAPEDSPRIESAVRLIKTAADDGLRVINGDRYLDGFSDFLTRRSLPPGHVCRAGDTAGIRMVDGSLKLCHSLPSLAGGPLGEQWESNEAVQLRNRMAQLDCPSCWLSCHADRRRRVSLHYGDPRLLEALQ